MLYDAVTSLVSGGIGLFAPERALRYKLGRDALKRISGRGYNASRIGGPNAKWVPTNSSAAVETINIARTRARCRDLVRNNPWIAGAMQTACHNIVGSGRDPQPIVEKDNGRPWTDLNKTLLELWYNWQEEADISGGSYYDIQELHLKHNFQDGELLKRPIIDKTRSGVPLKFELIEADQLVEGYNALDWYQGFKLSKSRKPLEYAFYGQHPGDLRGAGYSDIKIIPADQITHNFRKDRVTQIRGVPWLASIVWKIFDLEDYLEYEQIGAKLAAAFGVFVTSDSPVNILGTEDDKNENDDDLTLLEPGRIQRIRTNEKIQIAEHNRPNTGLEVFIRTILRCGASGLNMGYETLSNDYSQANYSSMRSSKLEERNHYLVIHNRQARQVYVPDYREFAKWAFWSGKIAVPLKSGKKQIIGFSEFSADPIRFSSVLYPPPVFPWVDPLKDINAEILAIKERLKSRTDYIKGQGKDPQDVFNTISEEEKEMKALGITPEKAEPAAKYPAPEEKENATKE